MDVGVLHQPGLVRIRVMLAVSALLMVPLCVLGNVTYSMTLALEGYHMLYNVLTLAGCLLSVRLTSNGGTAKNTFGWARLEVLVVVMSLLFLSALCFSVTVEAIQAIVQTGHHDAIHHPLYIMGCAAGMLLANLLCYCLIGGYTNLQSTFLTPELECVSPESTASVVALTSPPRRFSPYSPTSRLLRHFVRDIGGTLLVVICAVVVYVFGRDTPVVKYVDPVLTLLDVVMLIGTSRPLFHECCLILLQTMPDAFDADLLRGRLWRCTRPCRTCTNCTCGG